ncbi:hypothetical protein [Nonomuraea sp. NPDC005501]|uniref:hypothetical protein n=1 Tax=Nonomuraea sp. NPDC005501 TaxID=3156884 RepID=UPI0033B45213
MYSTENLTMPGTVRAARTIICIQLVITVLLNVILFLTLAVHGILLVVFFFELGASVLIGLVVIKMRSRARWVRWLGGVIEIALVANAVVGLSGGPNAGALAGLALAVAAIALLLTPSSAAWFNA